MPFDLSQDFLLVDDPVRVSYAVKGTEGTWAAPVTVDYCQRNAVTKADLNRHPSLQEKDASVFHLWAANLAAVVPKLGDKLSHGGNVWVAIEVEACDRDDDGPQRYRLVVQRSRGSQTL